MFSEDILHAGKGPAIFNTGQNYASRPNGEKCKEKNNKMNETIVQDINSKKILNMNSLQLKAYDF